MDRLRGTDARALVLRVILPAVLLWAAAVALGALVTGPLAQPLAAEDRINAALVVDRGTPADPIAAFFSYLGSTEMIALVGLAVAVAVGWRTRDWRRALVPVIAILLQLCTYLGVIALIARERPAVQRLDELLPMSSFPSGHVGASTALYLSCILLAGSIERRGLRLGVTLACVAVPLLVAAGRLMRGMHHLSDLFAGALIGAVCALLAYGWYRFCAARAGSDQAQRSAPVHPVHDVLGDGQTRRGRG